MISPSSAESQNLSVHPTYQDRVTILLLGDSYWTIIVSEIPSRCLNNPLIEQLFSNKRSPQAWRQARKSIKLPIMTEALGLYLVCGCQPSWRRSDFREPSFPQYVFVIKLPKFILGFTAMAPLKMHKWFRPLWIGLLFESWSLQSPAAVSQLT